MPLLHKIDHKPGDGHPDLMFWCPGCQCGHGVWITSHSGSGGHWEFNGNFEKPTFKPSLLIRREEWTPPVTPENMDEYKKNPWPQTKVEHRCHTVVVDGVINFCKDCTHALAGKSIPMQDF